MSEEEIFRKNYPEYCRGEVCLSPYFDLFCAGYNEATKENGIVWHDLRKDPNDLPKKVGNYLVCYLDTMLERHSFELSYVDYLEDGHWIDEDNDNIERYDEGVVAWAEIPQFEGVKL